MINDNGKVISRAANGRGETPLHVVCMSSNPSLDIVQLLVNAGGEAAVTVTD
jgi:ankyrin repeat protein